MLLVVRLASLVFGYVCGYYIHDHTTFLAVSVLAAISGLATLLAFQETVYDAHTGFPILRFASLVSLPALAWFIGYGVAESVFAWPF